MSLTRLSRRFPLLFFLRQFPSTSVIGVRHLESVVGVRALSIAAVTGQIRSNALELRTLDVPGVVEFAVSIGVDSDDADKLRAQKIDGAALLEMTEDRLRSCGVPLGPTLAILRAVAHAMVPRSAEVSTKVV